MHGLAKVGRWAFRDALDGLLVGHVHIEALLLPVPRVQVAIHKTKRKPELSEPGGESLFGLRNAVEDAKQVRE